MSKLLVLLAFISAVYAAGNTCTTGNIVNRLVNNQSYYWPATWNENQTAPELEHDQGCSWIVTIPQGYYARLIIDGGNESKDSKIVFQIIDSVGTMIQTSHETKEPYFFAPAKFTLTVSNLAVAKFAFKIQWIAHTTTLSKTNFVSTIGDVTNVTSSVTCEGFAGPEGISLLAFPENRKDFTSLRSVFIYEIQGGFKVGNYVNNLYQLYQTGKQYISKTQGVAICNLEASGKQDLLVIQSSDETKNLNYVELVTVAGKTFKATVNSEKQLSALISATYFNQTMVHVQMDDTDTVSVYYGTPDPFTFVKNHTGAELKAALPIDYEGHGGVIQWVLNRGKAVFTFWSIYYESS